MHSNLMSFESRAPLEAMKFKWQLVRRLHWLGRRVKPSSAGCQEEGGAESGEEAAAGPRGPGR